MVVNMNMHSDGEGAINEYLSDTILTVFDSVYTADVFLNSNRELFAMNGSDPGELLDSAVEKLEDPELQRLMRTVSARFEKCESTGRGYLLTDDKAPVEVLGMSMIDSLISEEMAYYKDVYAEQGIDGVMALLG